MGTMKPRETKMIRQCVKWTNVIAVAETDTAFAKEGEVESNY